MNSTAIPPLRTSRFTEFLIRENLLNMHGLTEWIFYPGMLYNAPDKWWDDAGMRNKPHEGLDLCLYRDEGGKVRCINNQTNIPVLYDGTVVSIIDDFLGKSIIVEHNFLECPGNRFCTMYGHLTLRQDLQVGSKLCEGDVLARVAAVDMARVNILPHVHISMGWIPECIPYHTLDWTIIGDPAKLLLADPLQIIDGGYTIVDQASLPAKRSLYPG